MFMFVGFLSVLWAVFGYGASGGVVSACLYDFDFV